MLLRITYSKYIVLIIFCFCFALTSCLFSTFQITQAQTETPIKSPYLNLKNLMIKSLPLKEMPSKTIIRAAITTHHIPNALTMAADVYKAIYNSRGPRKIFVVIGPDHFEACRGQISTTGRSYQTVFGDLRINKPLMQKLMKAGATNDDKCFEREHTVLAHAPLIKRLFPQSELVPLIFSSGTSQAGLDRIIAVLAKEKDVFIMASIDFSHYLKYNEAKKIDLASKDKILKLSTQFDLKSVDSPPALKLLIGLSKKQNLKPVFQKYMNSFNFNGNAGFTTGYLNFLFENNIKN
jgi:AmmeMemoRadiSam system protein B